MVYQINSQGLHLSGASRLQRNQSLCRSLAAFSISCPILLCFNLKLQCCASQQNWFLLRQERKKMLILGRWEGKRNRNIAFILKQSKTLQNLKSSFYILPHSPAAVSVCHWFQWKHQEISLVFLLVYSDIYREWSTSIPFQYHFFFNCSAFMYP